MRLGKFLAAGMLMLGTLSFGCAGDEAGGGAGGAVTLTSAHVTQDGDQITVSGLDHGVESSFLASKVTIDGVDFTDKASSVEGSDPHFVTCYVCVCSGNSCVCTEVACP